MPGMPFPTALPHGRAPRPAGWPHPMPTPGPTPAPARRPRAALPVALALALALVSGCDTGLRYYHRDGAAVSRMQTDTTQCEVEALAKAPVASQLRQDPPIYFPGATRCNASGQCWASPGYWAPGRVYSVDVNADLRGRVMDMCMAERGYQPVSLPACPEPVRRAAPARQTTVLPSLAANSCVIRYEGGGWQVVTPIPG